MLEIQEHELPHHQTAAPQPSSPQMPRKSSFLNFWQIFSLAVMVVLAANGLTSLGDIAFVIFSPLYLYLFISRFSFPRKQSEQRRQISNPRNKLFQAYFLSTAVFGLLLPIGYVADGVLRGDTYGVRAAAPHLFLLCGQVLFERFGFSDKFSMPIAILGPIFSNSRRIFALLDWLRVEFSETTQQRSPTRMFGGRVLSSVNIAVWFFNLFGLLLPVYLPRACKIYFSDSKGD